MALAEDRRVWLDLGSGGGFPGLVVAIMLAETGGHVHLVESDGRKAAFLRTVIREVGAPASVHNRRAEELATAEESFWQMWGPLVRVPWRPCRNYWSWWRRFSIHPQLLLHKGAGWQDELTRAEQCWNIDAEVHPAEHMTRRVFCACVISAVAEGPLE